MKARCGQADNVTQTVDAVPGKDRRTGASLSLKPRIAMPQSGDSFAAVLGAIVYHIRVRRQLLQAETRLAQQIKAIKRHVQDNEGGESQLPNVTLREFALPAPADGSETQGTLKTPEPEAPPSIFAALFLEPHRRAMRREKAKHERLAVEATKLLPVYTAFGVEKQKGLSAFGLAQIVEGAAARENHRQPNLCPGDLRNYATPAKLWTRFGLGLIGGEIQKRVKGSTKALKAKAIAMKYSPRRRALIHMIGSALIQHRNPTYYLLYLEEKAKQTEKLTAEGHPEKTLKCRAHRRALRKIEKALLKDVWIAWQGQTKIGTHLPGAGHLSMRNTLMAP